MELATSRNLLLFISMSCLSNVILSWPGRQMDTQTERRIAGQPRQTAGTHCCGIASEKGLSVLQGIMETNLNVRLNRRL